MTEPSAAATQPQFPGIIQWPCGNKPHGKTIRGFFAWRELVAFPAVVFLLFVVGPFVWGATMRWYGVKGAFEVYSLLSIPGAVVWVVYYAVMVMPVRKVFREGSARTAKWRAEWMQFERLSTDFTTRLHLASANQMDLRLSMVPELPSVRWHWLQYHQFSPDALPTAGADAQEVQSVQETMLLLMLGGLARMSQRQVLFRTYIENAPAIGACCMVAGNLQLWTVYSIRSVGTSLVPRVQSGINWWINPCVDDKGRRYLGDVWKYKCSTLGINGLVLFYVLLFVFVPPMAIFGCICLIVLGGREVLRQLVRRDQASQMKQACDFDFGDSTDLQVLQEARGMKGYGYLPSSGSTADYTAMQAHLPSLAAAVMNAVKQNR